MPLQSADELLMSVAAGQDAPPRVVADTPESKPEQEKKSLEDIQTTPLEGENTAREAEKLNEREEKRTLESKPEQESPNLNIQDSDDTDDYGNPKPVAKTYTEDEVNERINKAIRERLQRGNHEQQQQVQQQVKQDFKYDESGEGDWKQQLETFVLEVQQKSENKRVQEQRQLQEANIQAEFESRFAQGMAKFNDFEQVVRGKPISDAMTIATRAMKDPAAFLYAAAKHHQSDLQRISQIEDAAAQMVEIGRLEERMRKTKSATRAVKPVSKTGGDITEKPGYKRGNVDDKILAHAKSKNMR